MVSSIIRTASALLLLLALAGAAAAQSRTALVIGNGAYQSFPPLKTPATDAKLVAETLQAAGYSVTELHDVAQLDIGQVMRNFLDKVAAAGPGGTAFVYYSGHAARSKGENFLIPVDAIIDSEGEIENKTFRLKELTEELARLPLAARIIVLDASRDHQIGNANGRPAPKGLATTQVQPGMLIAFAAAPGAIGVEGDADYSLYTGTLVARMRQPGLDLAQTFKNTRAEVSKITAGLQTPWTRSALQANLHLSEPTGRQASEPEATPEERPRKRRSGHNDARRLIRYFLRNIPY